MEEHYVKNIQVVYSHNHTVIIPPPQKTKGNTDITQKFSGPGKH